MWFERFVISRDVVALRFPPRQLAGCHANLIEVATSWAASASLTLFLLACRLCHHRHRRGEGAMVADRHERRASATRSTCHEHGRDALCRRLRARGRPSALLRSSVPPGCSGLSMLTRRPPRVHGLDAAKAAAVGWSACGVRRATGAVPSCVFELWTAVVDWPLDAAASRTISSVAFRADHLRGDGAVCGLVTVSALFLVAGSGLPRPAPVADQVTDDCFALVVEPVFDATASLAR